METEIESLLSPRQQPHSVEPLRACREEHRHAVADVMRRLFADQAIEPLSQRLLRETPRNAFRFSEHRTIVQSLDNATRKPKD